MRIGIFGGSFDPPHCGHICAAKAFISEMKLDKLLIVPVPSYKNVCADDAGENKLALCKLAFDAIPHIEIWQGELLKGTFSYTAELLEEIAAVHEGSQLFFLTGSDVLHSMPHWYRSEDVFSMSAICCAVRDGHDGSIQEDVQKVRALGADVSILKSKMPDISSSMVRGSLHKKENISGIVVPAVEAYIHSHALYS